MLKNTLCAFAFAGLAACATAVPDTYVIPKTVAEATEGKGAPAIWKVADEDTTIYLMGTVHLLNADADWRSDSFKAAWAESTTAIFETDTSPEAQAAWQQMIPQLGLNPEGVTLASFFTEEEIASMNELIAPLGISIEAMARLRPWLANLQIATMTLASLGAVAEGGVDVVLAQEAHEREMDLHFLETGEMQLGLLSAGEDEVVADYMYLSLERQQAEAEAYFAELVFGWYTGRPEVHAAIIEREFDGYPAVRNRLLDNRNAAWADDLAEIMEKETGTYFLAVGAVHLAGDASLQKMLKARGYASTRID